MEKENGKVTNTVVYILVVENDSCYHPIFTVMRSREDEAACIHVTVTTTLE